MAALPLTFGAFDTIKSMSKELKDPTRACRPFDVTRSGFVMGEGAGVVAIEELEFAKKRGARIHAEIAGYAATADAHHMSAPLPNHEQAQRSRW